jgi:alkylhydroperoxidase family enzyme
VLAERFFQPAEVAAIARGDSVGLDEVDLAVMGLADKVAGDAGSVTQADVDRLRAVGLSDEEIVDVALAAAARSFFTKTLDALGVQPDSSYLELEPALRDALTVGRPIAAR